jgi:hypothetical protein
MSAGGQNPNASRTLVCQLPPAADIRRIGSGPLRATSGLVQRSKTVALINHLVGAREEGFRDREAHSLRSSEIDGQFELRGLLDG